MTEARQITPDMTPFERFKFGDTVAHINMGDGMVTKNDPNIILPVP